MRGYLAAADPRVRAHAAGGLVDLSDPAGVDALIDGIQSASVYERFYSLGRLEQLADAPSPSPGFSRQAWRAWWAERGPALPAR